ncbi:unnamed protein product [Tilletia controversa]|uniref:Peptidase M50B-like-domain-containing protein n=3 Tax=Tilletia TaxID=13289 RepID=A0A8X7MN75_9BASI|nr:hypothetical protein CF335_g7119 [Tilletia laevis]KAE8190271.1 hypothetical protein CF328_g6026 [Tilletia controversa]KAE8261669.1 hypothetical protein A4X03_0g3068 [Tilletia caries]KAE8192526.1 hypothetical protein CF336_g4396 [Tilletia laevis]KAE8242123.1 hypothetical protein A4X06_0g7214 [Tilletia controversa]
MPLLPQFAFDERSARYSLTRRAPTLEVNPTQKSTIIVACIYFLVIIVLWHFPILKYIIYPFKLLTVGFHEFGHAFAGVLTCARIESISLDPHEGGATRMRGGNPYITLPAGYLGSSLIGAALIACGFDEKASKIASIVVGAFFLVTLFWARKSIISWVLIIGMAALIVMFWFIADAIALRYLILFIGVMSCMYSVWDIIDDTISRKVNESDASAFAREIGIFPPQVWGVIWLFISIGFFAAGILVGIAAFKKSAEEQRTENETFLNPPP